MKKLMVFIVGAYFLLEIAVAQQVREWVIRPDNTAADILSDGNGFFITLGFTKVGGLNFYLSPNIPIPHCQHDSGGNLTASMKFNNVLVRLASDCTSGIYSVYPYTIQGRGYIINECVSKDKVVITSDRNEYIDTVSCVGFAKSMKQLLQSAGTTGGI